MTTTTIPTESGTYTAEYTNECSCEISNETYDEFAPADDCYGHCWEFTLEDFENITEHLFTDNEQGFTITGFPIWNGTRDGYFLARNAEELLRNITPDRTAWTLRLTVYPTHLTGVLSHHDAPTGGLITVTPFSQDE